ncbi:MAG: Xaa-Pro peptidase family protein, partial [Acidimicrobiia bacterium]
MTQTSSAEVYSSRLNRLRSVMTEEAVDLTLLSVGPDLPYFIGYEARPSERLTMLVVRPDDDPLLFMPRLEVPKVGDVPVEIVAWDETTDPLEAVGLMASSANRIAIGDHTWSMFLVELLRVKSDVDWLSSSRLTAPLRIAKDETELGLIRQAAEVVDRVLARIPGEVEFGGRSETEVASHLLAMTVAEGSDVAAHCIVGAGPNGASPHHDPGPNVIASGDLVVCDFGGRVGGYHSDVTRTFSVGEPEPFALEVHGVVEAANRAGRAAVS